MDPLIKLVPPFDGVIAPPFPPPEPAKKLWDKAIPGMPNKAVVATVEPAPPVPGPAPVPIAPPNGTALPEIAIRILLTLTSGYPVTIEIVPASPLVEVTLSPPAVAYRYNVFGILLAGYCEAPMPPDPPPPPPPLALPDAAAKPAPPPAPAPIHVNDTNLASSGIVHV